MACKYCNEGEYFQDKTYEDCLLELVVNKRNRSLEVHYCDKYYCLDYDQKEIKISYCPFCGDEL